MLMASELSKILPVDLFKRALTHPSTGQPDNQRLEFLGDAVLQLIVSEGLYQENPDFTEGKLSRARAWTVREETLAAAARKIGLGGLLILGRGEDKSGGRDRDSVLADALEAVIAAIYLARGYQETRTIVLPWLEEALCKIRDDEYLTDYKTELQERLQVSGQANFSYFLTRESGPDHDKTFWVELVLDDRTLARGQGKTKKQAEQQAARQALESNRL